MWYCIVTAAVDGKSFVADVQPSSKIPLEPLCRGSNPGPTPRRKRWAGEVSCTLNLCSGNYEFCYLCPGSLHIQVSLTACMCTVDLSALMYFIVFQNCFYWILLKNDSLEVFFCCSKLVLMLWGPNILALLYMSFLFCIARCMFFKSQPFVSKLRTEHTLASL